MDSKAIGKFWSRRFCALWVIALLPFSLQLSAGDRSESEVALTTADNYKIHATLIKPKRVNKESPAVILIHQGFSNREEWRFLFPRLVDQGYAVLAIDLRGHGNSQKLTTGKIAALFNDPEQAPFDLKAAIDFLAECDDIDSRRVAVVGASIGANLAVAGIHRYGVKTAVAVSGKTEAAQNLAGDKTLKLRRIYFIASMEQQGNRAAWAREMYEMTAEPRRLSIAKHSNSHGVGIFLDQPELVDQVIDWLAQTL